MCKGPLIIAGGGLAGGLAALALQRAQPEIEFVLVEGGSSFGGNHTWSCFDTDVPPSAAELLASLSPRRWPAHQVRFGAHSRTIEIGYLSVASERLHEAIIDHIPPERRRLDSPIARLTADHVALGDGSEIAGSPVIDCRGPAGPMPGMELAWQNFVGIEYDATSGVPAVPMVMDATPDQIGGYRFVYMLPFAADRVLVEDTYYTLDPALDVPTVSDRVAALAAERGITGTPGRTETGVLPLALDGDPAVFWPESDPVPRLGMAGGFFHPTTGYSIGLALRNAAELAALPNPLSAPVLAQWSRGAFLRHWQATGFFRLLNRMLFWAAPPGERRRIFAHFYRLDADTVARFYSGQLTALDKLRILSGKPPVGVGAAMMALAGRRPSWRQ